MTEGQKLNFQVERSTRFCRMNGYESKYGNHMQVGRYV